MRLACVHRWVSVLVAMLLCLLPATSLAAAPARPDPPAANPPASGPSAEPKAKSATEWLRIGEAREGDGDFAGAGEAYRNALEAMTGRQRRGNEGARAAMYSAEAYWLAFETDNDIKHLEAGFDALDRWLQLIDPAKPAKLESSVRWMMARLRGIYDPMRKGDAALAGGNVDQATEDYRKALEALTNQQRRWLTKARVGVHITDAQLSAYDEALAEGITYEAKIAMLEATRNDLEDVRKRRPQDDKSKEYERVEERMAEIQQRIDEANRAEAQRKQDEAVAKAKAEDEAAQKRAEEQRIADEKAARAYREQQRRRTAAIAVLTTGAVATAAGVGLLTEGLAFGRVGQRRGDEKAAKADAIDVGVEDPTDVMVDRPVFDPLLQTYRDDVRRYSMAMTVSGAVISSVGLAAVITGAVILSKNKGAKGRPPGQHAMLSPVVSPSLLGLSLTARFR